MTPNIRQAAALVLMHPLDPDFPIRTLRQFRTEFIQEFIRVCDGALRDIQTTLDEIKHDLDQLQNGMNTIDNTKHAMEKSLDYVNTHKRRCQVNGRMIALIRELNRRGLSVESIDLPAKSLRLARSDRQG